MEVMSALHPVSQPSWCCSDICMTRSGNFSLLRVFRRCPGCRPFLAYLTPSCTVYVLCSFFSVWTVGHPSTIPFKAFSSVSVDTRPTNFNRRRRDLPCSPFLEVLPPQLRTTTVVSSREPSLAPRGAVACPSLFHAFWHVNAPPILRISSRTLLLLHPRHGWMLRRVACLFPYLRGPASYKQ